MAEGEGFEPPVHFRVHRFSSTQKGSAPFGKFSTLLDFSTAYKSAKLNHYGSICTVLTLELLQFYYSDSRRPGDLADPCLDEVEAVSMSAIA